VTYTIIVDVANPDESLKPGMTAQTRIVVSSKPKVMRLPTAGLRFRPDEDSLKVKGAQAAASAASAPASAEEKARADDDGVLIATRSGARLYRVYTVGEKQVPKLHEVTIGIANTRFTELLSGDLKAGDEVITRTAEAAGKK
jgi:HlyD family secretion protein